jgi:hypothetical protein
MITWRPHGGGGFEESLKKSVSFQTEEDMKNYMSKYFNNTFLPQDIVIDKKSINDERIGWSNTHYVCVKKFMGKKYTIPQCFAYVNIT